MSFAALTKSHRNRYKLLRPVAKCLLILLSNYNFARVTAALTDWVSRAARPLLTQPPAPKSTIASAALFAAAEGGVGFTRC